MTDKSPQSSSQVAEDLRSDVTAGNYRTFVEESWKNASVTFAPIDAAVDGEPCRIVSVRAREAGSAYVNLLIKDERHTLIAAHHNWTRDNQEINDSAFFGVVSGAPADETLRPEPPAKTIEEARARERGKPLGKRYLLCCREDGFQSWRVISGVSFGPDYLDALSHFDWGEKQRFGFDAIAGLADVKTGTPISLEVLRRETESGGAGGAESAFSPKRIALLLVTVMAAAGAFYWALVKFSPLPQTGPEPKPQAQVAPAPAADRDAERLKPIAVSAPRPSAAVSDAQGARRVARDKKAHKGAERR